MTVDEIIEKKWKELYDVKNKHDNDDPKKKELLLAKVKELKNLGDDINRAKANIAHAVVLGRLFDEFSDVEKLAKSALDLWDQKDNDSIWYDAHHILSVYYLKKGEALLAKIHEHQWRKLYQFDEKQGEVFEKSLTYHFYKKKNPPPPKKYKDITGDKQFEEWLQGMETINYSEFPNIKKYVTNDNQFILEKRNWIYEIKNMLSRGIETPLNVLLLGSPGSGKSFFVKNISKEFGRCAFIEHNLSTFESCEQAYNIIIRDIIVSLLEEKNVILFLDEFDTQINERTIFESFIAPMNGQAFNFLGRAVELNNKNLLKRSNLLIFYAVSMEESSIGGANKGKDFLSRIHEHNKIRSLPSIKDDKIEIFIRCISLIKKYAPRLKKIHKRALLYIGLNKWLSTRDLEHSIIRAVKTLPRNKKLLDLTDFAVSTNEINEIKERTGINIFETDHKKIFVIN